MSPSSANRSHSEIFEKIPVHIFATPAAAARELAAEVRQLIESRRPQGRNAVLRFATGSTPLPFYRALIRPEN